MADGPDGLPRFPTEQTKQFEAALQRQPEPEDRFSDRVRHTLPSLVILGGATALWILFVGLIYADTSNPYTLLLFVVIPLNVIFRGYILNWIIENSRGRRGRE
jgi:hypothetical protein